MKCCRYSFQLYFLKLAVARGIMLSKRASRIRPSPTIGLNSRVLAMQRAGEDIVNFTIGEPDFPTPANVKQAGIRAIRNNVTKYTASSGTSELRQAISEKLRKDNGLSYPPEQVVVSNGSKQALFNALLAVVDNGGEVLIPSPYWASYVDMVLLAGGIPVPVRTDDAFQIDVGACTRALTKRTKAVIVNSPSNPTGAVFEKTSLKALAGATDCALISDEIYEKIIYEARHVSIARFAPERTIVVNGFSKAYAMTGWRMGYCAAPGPVATAIAAIQSQTSGSPSSIAQQAAYAAITGPQASVKKMAAAFRARRDLVMKRLGEMNVQCVKPKGAFYAFPEVPAGDSQSFSSLLLEQARVAVVPGREFGSDRHFRISYATGMKTLGKGMDRIEQAYAKLQKRPKVKDVWGLFPNWKTPTQKLKDEARKGGIKK